MPTDVFLTVRLRYLVEEFRTVRDKRAMAIEVDALSRCISCPFQTDHPHLSCQTPVEACVMHNSATPAGIYHMRGYQRARLIIRHTYRLKDFPTSPFCQRPALTSQEQCAHLLNTPAKPTGTDSSRFQSLRAPQTHQASHRRGTLYTLG